MHGIDTASSDRCLQFVCRGKTFSMSDDKSTCCNLSDRRFGSLPSDVNISSVVCFITWDLYPALKLKDLRCFNCQ